MDRMNNLIYRDMYQEDKYVRKRFESYKNILIQYLKEQTKILDIGCYTADLLNVLPNHISYYGLDSDEEALKIAKAKGARVFKVDLETGELPFKNSQFNIIVATEILEHLKDPEKLVIKILNLLKDDGVVLVSLPNECTLYHRFKVLLGKGIDGTGFVPHYHLHFPTIKQNEEFIGRYFKIIKKQYWIHLGEGKIEKIVSRIPYKIWLNLANMFPTLFARGIIFQLHKKK